jgi:type II secretory pathway pseudopilin PulG
MGQSKMNGSTTHKRVHRFQNLGFTLLEVMGAVMILAVMVISLSGSNIAGIRLETSAQQRTEAAALANEAITALELDISQHSASLEEEFTSEEVGFFTIESEIIEYEVELPTLEMDDLEDQHADDLNTGIDRPNPVRLIQVRVFWENQGRELMVQRTTFAVDQGMMGNMMDGMMDPNAMQGNPGGDPGFNNPQSPEQAQ